MIQTSRTVITRAETVTSEVPFETRQKTQAFFQPLKVTIQLVDSVQATSFSTERYRLASTDSIIADNQDQ